MSFQLIHTETVSLFNWALLERLDSAYSEFIRFWLEVFLHVTERTIARIFCTLCDQKRKLNFISLPIYYSAIQLTRHELFHILAGTVFRRELQNVIL